jgi:hypothetical protein
MTSFNACTHLGKYNYFKPQKRKGSQSRTETVRNAIVLTGAEPYRTVAPASATHSSDSAKLFLTFLDFESSTVIN